MAKRPVILLDPVSVSTGSMNKGSLFIRALCRRPSRQDTSTIGLFRYFGDNSSPIRPYAVFGSSRNPYLERVGCAGRKHLNKCEMQKSLDTCSYFYALYVRGVRTRRGVIEWPT